MDATKLLTQDHRDVEKLFKRFEAAGSHAYEAKRSIMTDITEALSVHATIEEQVFYPAVRSEVDGTNDEVLEALEEHHVVKWLLSELEDLAPDDERYQAKATVLIENVRHHVEEEEGELFPQVRKALSDKELDRIGEALDNAKQNAPTRPHPRSPDTPPGNLLVGPAAALVDSVAGRVRGAVSDTVDRVTGNGSNRDRSDTPSPSTVTRKASAKKSSATKTAAKKATATRSAAKKAASRTTSATKSAAKKAGATKSAAKRSAKKAPAKRTARATAKKSTAKKQATRRPANRAGAKRTGSARSTTRKTTANARSGSRS
jgi:hemerythrin superfamily protein